MKTKYFFLAAFAATFASCANEEYIGDTSPNAALEQAGGDGSIQFGFDFQNATRADIVGSGAADLLGNGFYVIGTKGDQETSSPSTKLVFDNYLVHYGINTAGTTESNTANWEYVGVTPGTGDYTNWVKLSDLSTQTIKYWDYSEAQYDFHAFSTGDKQAVSGKTTATIGDDEINVTKSLYGAGLAGGVTAYTFIIPTAEALKGAYITDITTVEKASYGKEVKLTFKNLGSKIRLALYETVPGYAVKDVQFYALDGTDNFTDANKNTTAKLISADATNGFFTKGTVAVSFPKVGSENSSDGNYKKASVSVTPVAPDPAEVVKYQGFGTLHNFAATKEGDEDDGNYIGRSLSTATYAGLPEVAYYQVVFPVTAGSALTLRVDYTLVSTDGSDEEIHVYGAKAVVPSTYTTWQPNYAYTYIFKISDNTNGWTDTDHTKAGLFPITFDAVVAEIKDVSGEQTTITTVATPSITTYQQNHTKTATPDEYSKATGKNIYVQVMDNSSTPATLKSNLNDVSPYVMSKLYEVTSTGTPISEATVLDALQNRTTAIAGTDDATLTGRNGITLTKSGTISNTVTSIVNGADDKAITVTAGQAAEITIGSLTADHTYAYVYDYGDVAKTVTTFYQPKTATTGSIIADGTRYITLAKLATIVAVTSGSEAADDDYIYFSKTTDGVKTTYSYYSVDGKEGNLPAGLLKVDKTSDLLTGNGTSTEVTAGDFVFDIYNRNTGKYAVKIIKIVA